jgi:NADH-quinone oxidoreductase subunit A
MLIEYIPIFLVLVIAVLFAASTVFSSKIFGPYRPNKIKTMPYESGKDP